MTSAQDSATRVSVTRRAASNTRSSDSARVSVTRRAVFITRHSDQNLAQNSTARVSSDSARVFNASAVSAALNEIFTVNLLTLIKAAVLTSSDISVFEL